MISPGSEQPDTSVKVLEQPRWAGLRRAWPKLLGLAIWLGLLAAYWHYVRSNDITPLESVQRLVEFMASSGAGIGQTLLAAVAPFATEQGIGKLRTSCKEDSTGTIRFLDQAGFRQIGIRFESALDMLAFDETPFLPAQQRAEAAGYEVITLAQARAEDPDADRRLYDVFAATIVDVPFPGGDRANPNYDNFRANVLDAPNTNPDAIFIARQAGQMVGMTALELLPNGIGITGMTGVLREHRSRGVAMALKLASFRYLRANGYTETRAHNDTANPSILALNEKLGYRRLPGWLAWEKEL